MIFSQPVVTLFNRIHHEGFDVVSQSNSWLEDPTSREVVAHVAIINHIQAIDSFNHPSFDNLRLWDSRAVEVYPTLQAFLKDYGDITPQDYYVLTSELDYHDAPLMVDDFKARNISLLEWKQSLDLHSLIAYSRRCLSDTEICYRLQDNLHLPSADFLSGCHYDRSISPFY